MFITKFVANRCLHYLKAYLVTNEDVLDSNSHSELTALIIYLERKSKP